MRVKFAISFLFVCLIAFLIGPLTGQSQQPPGRGGFGGRSGFGGGGGGFSGATMDPNAIFDAMARGGNTIKISDIRRGRDQATAWAQKNRITNGEFTRDQWFDYSKTWTAGGRADAGTSPPPAGGSTTAPGPQPGASGGDRGPRGRSNSGRDFDIVSFADMRFKQADRNGDGFLQVEEMSENLQAEKDKWDTNKDGRIDQDEFREYMKAWYEKKQAERGENGGDSGGGSGDGRGSLPPGASIGGDERPAYDLDKKVVVLRAGKLGDKMPAWFTEYDLDKDAQVALYEWKEKGGELAEFRKWDLNGDGFITPDEVLRVLATGKDPNAAPSGSDSRVASAGGPGRGGNSGGLGGLLNGMFGGRRPGGAQGGGTGKPGGGFTGGAGGFPGGMGGGRNRGMGGGSPAAGGGDTADDPRGAGGSRRPR